MALLTTLTHDLLGLTQVAGLDFLDLLVTDASEEVVTRGLVRATHWPCDLHVARDHSRPEHLPDPLEREITGVAICSILLEPGPKNFSYT